MNLQKELNNIKIDNEKTQLSQTQIQQKKQLKIILYKPEIPQNVGAAMRIAACVNASLHLIGPFGFLFENHSIFPQSEARRASMDYRENCDLFKYLDFEEFCEKNFIFSQSSNRIIAFTPHSDLSFYDIKPLENDFLLFGRESDGIPDYVLAKCSIITRIPISENCRSLNVCSAMSMAVSRWQI